MIDLYIALEVVPWNMDVKYWRNWYGQCETKTFEMTETSLLEPLPIFNVTPRETTHFHYTY